MLENYGDKFVLNVILANLFSPNLENLKKNI